MTICGSAKSYPQRSSTVVSDSILTLRVLERTGFRDVFFLGVRVYAPVTRVCACGHFSLCVCMCVIVRTNVCVKLSLCFGGWSDRTILAAGRKFVSGHSESYDTIGDNSIQHHVTITPVVTQKKVHSIIILYVLFSVNRLMFIDDLYRVDLLALFRCGNQSCSMCTFNSANELILLINCKDVTVFRILRA